MPKQTPDEAEKINDPATEDEKDSNEENDSDINEQEEDVANEDNKKKKGSASTKKKTENFIEKIRSTVRGRKRNAKATTQRYLPIAEIRNDTVILKNNGLRAVLIVEPLNFNLKSETEQEGIISGYQNFLNTLTFPIQIIVSSTRINIDPYINKIHERAKTQQNALLKEQSLMYATFIEKLVEVADIMQKRFYIVVPQDDSTPKQNSFSQFFGWMKTDDTAAKVTERNKRFQRRSVLLRDRVNLVESGLHNVGIMSRRLGTQELIELYYNFYNPQTSQEQKLPKDLNTEKFTL